MLRFVVAAGLFLCCGMPSGVGEAADTAENIALGKTYTLFPSPSYALSTDPDDKVQLTDGQTTTAYFWTQPGTVGWQSVAYAAVTVDLGKVEPIGRAAFTTAAGVAGVTWPMAAYVLTSDDARTWKNAGDLVAIDHSSRGPWPEKYAIRRVSGELQTRGRYVQLVIIPLPGAPYLFTDEIEVFRGAEELLSKAPSGEVVTPEGIYQQGRIARSIRHRLEEDAAGIEKAIRESELPDAEQRALLEKLASIRREGERLQPPHSTEGFQAVLPLNDVHARLFGLQAEFWRRNVSNAGRELALRPALPWDPVELCGPIPASDARQAVEIHAMRGEYRSAAVNLYHGGTSPVEVRLRFEGIPPALARCLTVHEVAWTDTAQGVPIAAALPEARRDGRDWIVTAKPGIVRQVWLTFHPADVEPGDYRGTMTFVAAGEDPSPLPLRIRVWPLTFPAETTLWLGGWSYTDGRGSYGISTANRAAFLAHLQNRFVNAPWATGAVMPVSQIAAAGDKLDTARFDDWIAQWPDAKAYLVFLAVGNYSGVSRSAGPLKPGTPEFHRAVGTWISAWVRHLRTKGIEPSRLALLIHDEPHEGTDTGPLIAWAKAIQEAEPEVLIWEDPTYRDPHLAPSELFEVCDILCPNRPMWLDQSKQFADFYLDQQQRGRTLHLYSCSGPAKLLDPYSYHRLQAWHAWHIGAKGSFFWAFGDNSGASSWNEYFAKAGPFTPLFLDEKTVTAGKHMEAIRESVEDYEYFVMLERAVERAKAAGRKDGVAQAEALLKTGPQRVLEASGAGEIRWHEPKDRSLADSVRIEVLEALATLERPPQ